jgi:hypothetical protein
MDKARMTSGTTQAWLAWDNAIPVSVSLALRETGTSATQSSPS